MREHRIPFSELALIAATRGMLGAGIGLLAAERLRSQTRHVVGWTLFAIGAISTIPIVLRQLRGPSERELNGPHTVAG